MIKYILDLLVLCNFTTAVTPFCMFLHEYRVVSIIASELENFQPACNHQMIWSELSSMSCAAIHLLSLIPVFCSMTRTSQHLLMQYGRFVKVMSQRIYQMTTFSMSWMVEHLYNASHGPAVLHMETSATSKQNM